MWHHSRGSSKIPRSELASLQQPIGETFRWQRDVDPAGTTSSSSSRICQQKLAIGQYLRGDKQVDGSTTVRLPHPRPFALAAHTALLGTSLIMQLFCTLINAWLLLGDQQLWWLLTEWIIAKISSCLYELSPHALTRFLVGLLLLVFIVDVFVVLFCLTLFFSLMWMSGEVLVI